MERLIECGRNRNYPGKLYLERFLRSKVRESCKMTGILIPVCLFRSLPSCNKLSQ